MQVAIIEENVVPGEPFELDERLLRYDDGNGDAVLLEVVDLGDDGLWLRYMVTLEEDEEDLDEDDVVDAVIHLAQGGDLPEGGYQIGEVNL